MHTGSALFRDGDYYGRAVNLAARVARERPAARSWSRARSSGRRPAPGLPADRRGQTQGLRASRRSCSWPGRPSDDRDAGREDRVAGRAGVSSCFSRRARLDVPARSGRAARRAWSSRCTSTTACAAPSPTPTRRTAARSARGSACELRVHRAGRAGGQRAGLGARRSATPRRERLAAERDALIAVGHTATDQAETVLYRLAASPGRRALLGMPERSGRDRPAAAGHDARGDRGVLRARAGWRGARTRRTRPPRAACIRDTPARPARLHPAAEDERPARRWRRCATRPRCSTLR